MFVTNDVLLADQLSETLESVLGVPDSLLESLGTAELLVALETDGTGDHALAVSVGNDVEVSIGGQDGDGAVGASKVDSDNNLFDQFVKPLISPRGKSHGPSRLQVSHVSSWR